MANRRECALDRMAPAELWMYFHMSRRHGVITIDNPGLGGVNFQPGG